MLGATRQRINVGHAAQQDPILAYSTAMAANLLKIAAKRRVKEPMSWLRRELNKANPGDGNAFLQHAQQMAGGRNADQSMFDALRLTLANRVAVHADKLAIQHSAAGLGDSVADINAVMCGIMGVATTGGSVYSGASENPSGSSAIGQAGASAMSANGCNRQVMEQDTMRAQFDANAAASSLAAQQGRQDKTLLIVGIGGGLVVVGLMGILAFKK